MKQKRILKVVITFLAIFCIGTFTNKANATEVTGHMGVTAYRSSGYGYRVNERTSSKDTVWKIVKFPNYISDTEPGTKDDSNLIYCLRAGVGFTANSSKYPNYTINYDMKTKQEEVLNIMNGILTADGLTQEQINTYNANYNKILWILDNIYVKDQQNAIYREKLLTNAGITSNLFATITDDDIEVAQQLAIWYYTNFDESAYNNPDFTTIYLGQNDNYLALADYGASGIVRQAAMEKIFKYFVINADINSQYTSTNTSPIVINKDNAICTEESANYIFGPYEITKNSNLQYEASFQFNKTGYTLKDGNGNVITDLNKAIKDLAINSTLKLYAYLPITLGLEGNFEFSYEFSYTQTTATFIITGLDTANGEQPLVNIEKTLHEDPGSKSIQIPKKQYDFSLRKFITAINGIPVEISRVPVADPTNLNKIINGTLIKTATYNHTKAPLEVKKGDIVTYTIRVYNEGELDGYVSEITDYLPEWLDFVQPEDLVNPENWNEYENDNISYGWIKTGRTIKTDITAKDTIYSELQSEIYSSRGAQKTLLSKYTVGNDLDFIDVKINCVVNNSVTKGILITNVADISGMTDVNGVSLEADRDSEPGNGPKLSGDALQNYTGKDTYTVDELGNSSNYYKGQQDDDDFEKLIVNPPEIDLKLIKNITEVNGEPITERLQSIDTTKLNRIGTDGKLITTATYNMDKDPVLVKKDNIVTYRLRIYNEGLIDGYATKITENIPEGLEYLPDNETNILYGWSNFEYDSNGKITKISTDYLSREKELVPGNGDNLLRAFGENDGTKVFNNTNYREVLVKMKVISDDKLETVIRNEAYISEDSDIDGNDIDDRDSNPHTWVKYEDDEDYDRIILKPFDLSLRKYITAVSKNTTIKPENKLTLPNGKYIREPIVDTSKLNTVDQNGEAITTAIYNHTKEVIEVKKGDYIVYTIRVYNEGYRDGYAAEIKDHLPEYLEYVDCEFNRDFGWDISEDGRTVTTDYLKNELLSKYVEGNTPDYADVQIMCIVKEEANYDEKITNIADITVYLDENKEAVLDRDSQINNVELPIDENLPTYKDDVTGTYIPGQQDDDDFEKVLIKSFDLALRKFITGVNNLSVNNRYPELSYDEDAKKIVYTHTKKPLEVKNGNIVTYTIRIYNEGQTDGYANLVKDDIPEGLVFLPDNSTNIEYGWKMYKILETYDGIEYVETEDPENADVIITDYLSEDKETSDRQNKLVAFNKEEGLNSTNPDFRDVKVAFLVVEPNTSDRIIINKAEIEEDSDDDIDSVPGKWNDGEDDQDIEKLIVNYFDLALKKWVTEAIVTEDGKTNIYETGHTAEQDPEPIVKVEIKSKKINTVTVKFKYNIRVTNEGTIAGYAYELKDYIPEGLKFVQEDNPLWTDLGGGVISTSQLEKTLLQPGETATVDVILTWINGQDNMGLKINVAEISKDSDDDIDSVPDNKVSKEDDIDDAPVMLSVKTGEMRIYFLLSGAVLITLAGGIVLIRKFVL